MITDVRRGTSGTSRDVPIFVQFLKVIVNLMKMTEKKMLQKKGRFGEKVNERESEGERE